MTRVHTLLAILFLSFTPEWSLAQSKLAKEPAIVPHEEFALQYLEERGLAEADRSAVDPEALIAAEFVRFDLGLYDLRFPYEDLAEAESADNFRELALSLLGSQRLFATWVGADGDKQMKSDFKSLEKWIKSWKAKSLEKVSKDKPPLLVAGLKTSEKTLEALARFSTWMRTGQPLALNRSAEVASRILFMPTRPRFLKFVCFAGWFYPDLESTFWDKGLGTWLGCRVQDTQVIALQYASPDISEADFELGLPLNYKYEDVMQQHAVHFATQSLFDNYYYDAVPGFASTGFAMNLVLEQFESLRTRIEGDLRARFTESFTVFIPGAASDGILPPYNPDGRWRQNQGVDHFIELLQETQKNGNDYVRNAKEKGLKFEILADDEKQKTAVVAPFLGPLAQNKELPAQEFLGDYQEFFRAYKCAFTWWLQTIAPGSKSKASKAFAKVLHTQAKNSAVPFESILLEVYGAPISEERPGKGSLEGQFLIWLAKQ